MTTKTETITLAVTRTTYDGTPETLPELVYEGLISESCYVFPSNRNIVFQANLVKNDEGLWWGSEEMYTSVETGDIWFPLGEIAQIATAKPSGVSLIAAERAKQVERYSAERDAEYQDSELGFAAAYYAMPCMIRVDGAFIKPDHLFVETGWSDEHAKRHQKSRIEQLTVAGAFCAAEIDRLNREKEESND